ncbi:MAG: exodeoxyribonuclease III [Caldilineae bacterium]|nr:MAG: exodeoxyribonuclease III [Caldilineae bacterium]
MPTCLLLYSWNVNGIRALHRKGIFLDWLRETRPDIVCLQETRAEAGQLPDALRQPDGYHAVWHAARSRRGYSGTALLSRRRPLQVEFGLGIPEFDREGRTITAFFDGFILVNCYFPNGGRDHSRVPFKLAFYEAFLEHCRRLRDYDLPLIFCGDVNTAHREIDLARPRANRKTTGFLPEERAWIDRVLLAGYVDSFRHFYPDLPGQYTWWSLPTRARERNVGWRLDYFFVAREALPALTDAFIRPDVMGSDHCPVGIGWRVENE